MALLCTLNITTVDGYSYTEHLLALKRCAPHFSHSYSNLLYCCGLTEHVECIKEWLLHFIVESLKDWVLQRYGWDSAVEMLKHYQQEALHNMRRFRGWLSQNCLQQQSGG